jgi:hypothetical protein
VQGARLLLPPSPLPSGPYVPASGAPGDREGGGVTACQLPTHMLQQGFPTALIHQDMTRHLSYLMNHPPPQGNAPASEPEPETMFWAATGVGGGIGGERERGGLGGGRWKGGGEACVQVK